MPEHSAPRILVVDDEVPQVRALCETLESEGYDTFGVTSGEAAFAALRSQRFDLILTDLMLPNTDGIAVLREALQIDPELVGIIMTGQGTIATAVEAMKSGALDYILKPFKLSLVIPILSRALAVRKLRIENAELTRNLQERTTELEVANKDLEDFASSVSHDLRAPLRAINGFSAILVEDYSPHLPDEAQQLANTIRSSAKQMAALVDDLLRLSRLGRHTLAKEQVSMSNIAQTVSTEMEPDRVGRQIELSIGELPDCIGDPSLLKQVYVNLLSNAIKFTRQRDPAIIEIGFAEQHGTSAYFVRDNGAGFDMNRAQHLFGVFKRFHDSEEFEGTGVGLSIVHRIINRHGGRIWVESELDRGATFYFSLQ
jgi:two-component system, sensor histidine kinase and response regulator